MTQSPLAIVAGAGSGLGQALLERFQKEGMKAVGLSRNPTSESALDIRACDVTSQAAIDAVIPALIEEYGAPQIVVHNTAHLVISAFEKTTQDDFEACWRNMVLSAALLGQSTLPSMAKAGRGALIVSGATASLRGGANFAAFASAKFALRGLTQSMARSYQSQGVHVVHTILDGIIDTPASRELHSLDPSKMMKVEDLAQAYLQLAQQPQSTWTHELDLRPQTEGF